MAAAAVLREHCYPLSHRPSHRWLPAVAATGAAPPASERDKKGTSFLCARRRRWLSQALCCSQARPRVLPGERRGKSTNEHNLEGPQGRCGGLGRRRGGGGGDDRPAPPEPRRRRGVPRRRRRRNGTRRRSAVEVQHATRDVVDALLALVPPSITFSHDSITGLLWCFTRHTNINNFLRR